MQQRLAVLLFVAAAACTQSQPAPPIGSRPATGAPVALATPVDQAAPADATVAKPPAPKRPSFGADATFADKLAAWTEFTLAQPLPEYSLNEWSRTVPATGRLQCPDVEMVNYRGKTLRYGKTMKVYKDIVPHIEKMEEVISEVAIEVYGRAPSRVQTLGTLNCRRMRTYPTYLSEHAFANAIDVAGFEFPAANKAQRKTVPKALWGAQTVTVLGDWNGGRGNKKTHQLFLQKLVIRLLEDDVFRLYLGPVFPGHQDHFHFDMSNFRMVEI